MARAFSPGFAIGCPGATPQEPSHRVGPSGPQRPAQVGRQNRRLRAPGRRVRPCRRLRPSHLDMGGMDRDLGAVDILNSLQRPLAQIVANLDDSVMAAGTEAYLAALTYYVAVKRPAPSYLAPNPSPTTSGNASQAAAPARAESTLTPNSATPYPRRRTDGWLRSGPSHRRRKCG